MNYRRTRGMRGFLLRRIERKRNEVIFWGITFIAALAALAVATAALSREPAFSIVSVSIRGAEAVPSASIAAAVDAALSESYAGVVLKRNMLFYPRGGVARAVEALSERIREVTTAAKENDLLVTVSEREPRGRWCGRAAQADGEKEPPCYLFDESGYLFAEAGSIAPNPSVFGPLINSRGALIGGSVAPEVLAVLDNLEERLRLAGIPLASFAALSERDFSLTTESGVRILFVGDMKPETLLMSLYAVLKTDDLKTRLDDGSIEYLDFRFDDKVFYK